MAKKIIFVGFGMIITLMMLSSTLFLIFQNDNNDVCTSSLILLVKGYENELYANSSDVDEFINTSIIKSFWIEPCYTIDWERINHTIDTFIGNEYNVHNEFGKYQYIQNNSQNRIFVNLDGSLNYYNSGYTNKIIKQSDLLSDDELLSKSMSIMEKIGLNKSQFYLEEIINEKSSQYNSLKNISSVPGYNEQWIIYRQYINGVPVVGLRGRVIFKFGYDEELILFLDESIRINKKVELDYNTKSKKEFIDHLANLTIDQEKNYIIHSCDLVIHVNKDEILSPKAFGPCYECKFSNLDGMNPRIEFYNSFSFQHIY